MPYAGKPKSDTERRNETFTALELRAQGLGVDEIAEELGVSPRTAQRRLETGLTTIPARSTDSLVGEAELNLRAAMREVGRILFDTDQPADVRLKASAEWRAYVGQFCKLLGLNEPPAITEALLRRDLNLEG